MRVTHQDARADIARLFMSQRDLLVTGSVQWHTGPGSVVKLDLRSALDMGASVYFCGNNRLAKRKLLPC